MRRRVKDFIEISDFTSLERLIVTLTALRDSLPEHAEPELKLKGDDVFGRRISISYFRELTDEEAACEARYAAPPQDPAIEQLRGQLDNVPFEQKKNRRAA